MRPSTSDDARGVARAKIDGVLVGIVGLSVPATLYVVKSL